MPILVPMKRAAFNAFAAISNEAYARNNVLAGRWSVEESITKSSEEFQRLVPNGIDSSDHFFYDIQSVAAQIVGHLWFAAIRACDAGIGYVYYIHIGSDYRGAGYAKAALLALDQIAVDMGLAAIRLNVFRHNPNALALYSSLGYQVTTFSMSKTLQVIPRLRSPSPRGN
jgi:ribosomal protein S18 acetylase RimI-like enzyme